MVKAYIGMGGNVASAAGEPPATLAAARERLAALGKVVASSGLYSTTPVGFSDQPRFVNAVVELATRLTPRALLVQLLHIEHEFGRDRTSGPRFGPRTLDLDLLLYGDAVLEGFDLEVPHPRLHQRMFVLTPLAQIAPDLREPRSGCNVAELLSRLEQSEAAQEELVLPIDSAEWR
jgi:2-amino-4-hydroxy-6-hydroxymethyldihydropteridine diphosphokinase